MVKSLIGVDRQHSAMTILTLNRPEKRNALNIALLDEFCKRYSETEQLPDQRVVIINAAGPAFCAGMDLNEAADPACVEPLAKLIAKMFTTIYNSNLISIAAVQGPALGGGVGLVSACDIAIAAHSVQFSYPEVHRGLVPAQVSALLRRQISLRHARELLLTGLPIIAQRAYEIGLINSVAAEVDVMPKALGMAEAILKGKPKTVIETKHLLVDLELISLADDLEIAMAAHQRARLTEEAQGGIASFFK